MTRAFRALRNYNYRLFWLGQLVSLCGTWMQMTAQAWLVLQLTNAPVSIGVVVSLQTLPILVFSLFGGVFADRLPKRAFLTVTQSVAAAQALALAALTSTGAVQLWHVYGLAVVLGLVNAFDNPARQAFVAEMVGPDDLPNAVALNSSLFNAARVVGPALAGVTIATIGTAGAFYANAASFVPVIAALRAMRPELLRPGPPAARGNVFRQVRDGLAFVARTPAALVVVLLMAVLGTFGYNFSVTLPLLARFVLRTGAVGFGGLTAFMGVGSLLGALALAYRSTATTRLLIGASAAFSLLLLAVARSASYPVTAALLVLLGVASIAYTATANTLLQLASPADLRGRVMSIYFLLFAGSTPIGGVLTGAAAARIGVGETLAVEALVCALGVGVAAWRSLRRPVEAQRTGRAPLHAS